MKLHQVCFTFCITFALSGQSNTAQAMLDMDVRTSAYNQLDFSLSISLLETELSNTGISTRIKFRRIGVNSFDVPAHGIQFGGHLGYAYTSQDRIAATQGIDLNGYYLGLGLRLPLVKQDYFQAQFIADYLYQSVDGARGDQSASRYWHEYLAGFNLSTRISAIQLFAGLYYKKIDATQEAYGDIRETLFLDNPDKSLQVLGMKYLLNPGETVGIQFSNGASKGVEFLFQKYF